MDYKQKEAELNYNALQENGDSGFGYSFDQNEEAEVGEKLQNLHLPDSSSHSSEVADELFQQDDDGDSYLHIAIRELKDAKALRLINCGTSEELSLKNDLGETPLMLAVHFGMYGIVRELIDCGADVKAVDFMAMNNIVHIAAGNQDSQMLKVIFGESEYLTEEISKSLLSLRDMANNEGFVPLQIAVRNQDLEFVNLLMLLKVNVEAQDRKAGFTALHHAVLSGNADWVNDFIRECNPFLETKSYGGETAYRLAVINGCSKIQQILIKAGAFIDEEMEAVET